jgi:ABC-2 type transport system permease protein
MSGVIGGFIYKEIRQTLRDKRMRILLFVAPCLQMTLFGIALSTETRNVRLTVAGTSSDPELEDIRQRALASGWFLDTPHHGADPFTLIRSGQADIVLVPRGDLSAEAGTDGGKLQALIDATNMTRAQGMHSYLRTIIHQKLQKESAIAPPVAFDVRILYNPTLRTAVYLVPGIMSIVTCLVTILLTGMSIAREKEVGTFEMIIAAPVRAAEVILGKTVPYVLLGMANIPLILSVAIFVFGVPMRGSFLGLLLASFTFICATVSIGTLISTVTRSQQQAMMAGFIYLMPSILVSGLLSPVATMPIPLKVLAYSNPVTYYMELLRNIMLKGGDPDLYGRNIAVMFLMAIVLGALSVRRFKTTTLGS